MQGSPGFGIPGQRGPKGENGERVSYNLTFKPCCHHIIPKQNNSNGRIRLIALIFMVYPSFHSQGNVGLSGKPGPKVSGNSLFCLKLL